MYTPQTIWIIFFSIVLLTGIGRALLIFTYNSRRTKTNYKKLDDYRVQAYDRLKRALRSRTINLTNDNDIVLHHNLFSSANDFFLFMDLLEDANKKDFWYSENTSRCLKEYIDILNDRLVLAGLTKNSADIFFMNFGIDYYTLFEKYQSLLLDALTADLKTTYQIKTFIAIKNSEHTFGYIHENQKREI